MTTTYYFIRYWFPVVVWCAVIFIQSAYPSPQSLPRFPMSDKLWHLIAYGILAGFICRATNTLARYRRRWRLIFTIGVIAATLYGLSDEWHQSFVAVRNAEAADLAADFIGSAVGAVAYLMVQQRRNM